MSEDIPPSYVAVNDAENQEEYRVHLEYSKNVKGAMFNDKPQDLGLWRGVLGEFVATLLFLLSILATYPGSSNVHIALTFGLAIAVLVQVFAGISGGHVNNCVTWGLFMAGRCSLLRTVLYTVAQVAGAICGAAIAFYTFPDHASDTLFKGFNYGVCATATTVMSTLVLEAIFTGLLVTTVLVVTDSRRPVSNSNASLAIGLTVLFSHLCIVHVTGSAINPARATGSAVVAAEFGDLWKYWVGDYIGATLAAWLYELVLAQPPRN